jgi:ABC-type transport system involved in Fe-S cluster assembly fused permease/ATPase subunit
MMESAALRLMMSSALQQAIRLVGTPLAMHTFVICHAAGKSSVVSLVMRYYDATQGKVSLTSCTAADMFSQPDTIQCL